ncbi:hypothetical protein GHT09_002522 [Marmota monax]|uniref:Uncharacterized protein n=1 Tax=Marmota monax TaxID=9995 RepID=A0A834R1F1_MARMO|nr:hypothetical protein GHT09_002522 [Marmota monax]
MAIGRARTTGGRNGRAPGHPGTGDFHCGNQMQAQDRERSKQQKKGAFVTYSTNATNWKSVGNLTSQGTTMYALSPRVQGPGCRASQEAKAAATPTGSLAPTSHHLPYSQGSTGPPLEPLLPGGDWRSAYMMRLQRDSRQGKANRSNECIQLGKLQGLVPSRTLPQATSPTLEKPLSKHGIGGRNGCSCSQWPHPPTPHSFVTKTTMCFPWQAQHAVATAVALIKLH